MTVTLKGLQAKNNEKNDKKFKTFMNKMTVGNEEEEIKKYTKIIEINGIKVKNLDCDVKEFTKKYGDEMEKIEIDITLVCGTLDRMREEVRIMNLNKKDSLKLKQKLDRLDTQITQIEKSRPFWPKVRPSYSPTPPRKEFSRINRSKEIPFKLTVKQDDGDTFTSPNESSITKTNNRRLKCLLSFQYTINHRGDSKSRLFFKAIQPLLDGLFLYKKTSGTFPTFDPVSSDPMSIAKCGYKLRHFKLSRFLNKIDIRNPDVPGVDLSFLIKHIVNPIIPEHTLQVIKARQKASPELSLEFDKDYELMKNSQIFDYKNPAFIAKSQHSKHFPFSILLKDGTRIQLIAEEYLLFKTFLDGVAALLKNKKYLDIFKYNITTRK